jgi:hypothetical protein
MSVSLTVQSSSVPVNLKANTNTKLSLTAQNVHPEMSGNYETLTNKPTLDGKIIIGEMKERDPTVSDWAKEPSRPMYTAQEVGAVAKDDLQELGIEELNKLWEEL